MEKPGRPADDPRPVPASSRKPKITVRANDHPNAVGGSGLSGAVLMNAKEGYLAVATEHQSRGTLDKAGLEHLDCPEWLVFRKFVCREPEVLIGWADLAGTDCV